MPTPKQELSKYISISDMSTGYIDQMDLFTVRRYGAVAGSTESQALSIDATISASKNAGSKIVFFPPGNYHTTALVDSTSVRFVGDNAVFTTSYGGSTYPISQMFSLNLINNINADNGGNITIASGSSTLTIDSTGSTITLSVADSSTVSGLLTTAGSFTTSISYLYASDSSHATRLSNLELNATSHATRLSNLETETTNIRTDLNAHTTNTQLHLNILTTPGDLVSYSTANQIYRVPRGTAGELLITSTNQTVSWSPVSAVVGTALTDVEILSWVLS